VRAGAGRGIYALLNPFLHLPVGKESHMALLFILSDTSINLHTTAQVISSKKEVVFIRLSFRTKREILNERYNAGCIRFLAMLEMTENIFLRFILFQSVSHHFHN